MSSPVADEQDQDKEPSKEDSTDTENTAKPQAQIPQEGVDASLLEQLNTAMHKADENWETVLRTKAELENLRKRTERDVENAHKYAIEKIATELLAVRDSMELGLGASQEGTDLQSLREGSELTLKMLTQVMEKFDIREINPLQQKFDPDLHQAIATQESEKLPPNTVVSVMQKGYSLKDRLLRPALVTVAKSSKKNNEKT